MLVLASSRIAPHIARPGRASAGPFALAILLASVTFQSLTPPAAPSTPATRGAELSGATVAR
jgi:hypothetical protein